MAVAVRDDCVAIDVDFLAIAYLGYKLDMVDACGAAATAAHVAAPDPAGPKKMAEDLGLELDEDNGVDFKKMPRVV